MRAAGTPWGTLMGLPARVPSRTNWNVHMVERGAILKGPNPI